MSGLAQDNAIRSQHDNTQRNGDLEVVVTGARGAKSRAAFAKALPSFATESSSVESEESDEAHPEPRRTTMESFLGEVTLFAGDFAPRGWVRCDGQLLPIGQNQALFAILSNRFGGSQAQGTFALPTISPATKGVHYIVCVAGMFPTR